MGILNWLLGRSKARKLKKYKQLVARINALEPSVSALTDEQLKEKTIQFKARFHNGETLDDLLPEAFACVREAASRTLGQRHYDVQLIGGIVLHEGKIAEMKTGEGKTLVATLPAYLNALSGKPVHIVTVNDYLAARDANTMGRVHTFLGLTVGCITHSVTDSARHQAYRADITYGTNNEMGFDYLRDNMKYTLEEVVQRGHSFVIVDEVDSILIDEARTPLIISGPLDQLSNLYTKLDVLVDHFITQDYDIDEKNHSITLTEEGNEHAEKLLREYDLLQEGNLYDAENILLVHHLNNALRAHKMFKRNKDYIVKNDKIIIIDEFTGRMMEGRRYSDGLHQALEAKEHVTIQNENQTLASITFQNYFRMYEKLAGMTGTAVTEADEFLEIYKLEVVEIPTHVPVIRQDHDDEIYRSAEEKYEALVKEVKACLERSQPVLIGTVSIEKSDILSGYLKQNGIKHNVLNARYHEQEAHIIAQAGVPGTVTIATNMAGRGTDIQLGGNPAMLEEQEGVEGQEPKINFGESRQKAVEAGGLYVMGTERHESRRIDNQLRGRSGRQGDPGMSKFFLSLEDDLLRIFGSQKLEPVLKKLGFGHGESISHPMVSKMLARAQKKVEAHNFDIRKNVLQYDNVANDQRKVFFENRLDIMRSPDVGDIIHGFITQTIDDILAEYTPKHLYWEQWDKEALQRRVAHTFGCTLPLEQEMKAQELRQDILEKVKTIARDRAEQIGHEALAQMEKTILLHTFDELWREHIACLEYLRQSINLRAYGQRDPLNEYKRDAFDLFGSLLTRIRHQCVYHLMHIQFTIAPTTSAAEPTETFPPPPNRNALCPCGSGKKYKHCHGALH